MRQDHLTEYWERDYQAAIQPLMNLIAEQNKKIEDLSKKVEPMVEMFSNIKWGEKLLIRLGVFFGGLVGFILGAIQIYKEIKK